MDWGVEFSDRGPKPVAPNRNPETVVVKKVNCTHFLTIRPDGFIHLTIEFYILLKQIPTSEAAVERVFSRHKLVQSQIQASLRDDMVENIMFLRYDLPFWGKKDTDRH